jgi:hypothetical protein
MDTSIFETEQGAVNPVDLSQSKPRVEVKEQTPNAVSSDEEKMAAGISTIGLQAKRLSGAQRKKLMKAKKTTEGTWTERKPPRKTPSPQDKGAEGGSGDKKTPLRLQHTILRQTATEKTQEYSSTNWDI